MSSHTRTMSIKPILLAVAALFLAGCVSVPDAIRGTTETPQQDFPAVREAPQIFVGQEARFGGTVINIKNTAGHTRLEIATVPLDSGGRPLLDVPSQGRLFANVPGFLEPTDFRDHLVTVVGPITGSEQGKIGDTPYRFVVMDVTGYKRWNLQQQVIMPPAPPMWGPGFRHGPMYPWGWYPRGPAHIETVVSE